MRFRDIRPWKYGFLVLLSGSLSVVLAQATLTMVPDDNNMLQYFRHPSVGISGAWEWGALVGIEDQQAHQPMFYVVDREGKVERIPFAIPDSGFIQAAWGIARGPDGALAVSGSAYSADGKRAGFVAWISPDRQRQIVTRTPVIGDVVTLAPDGTIWTAGWEEDPEGGPARHNVFQRVDSSGKLLGSSIARARGASNTPMDAVGLSRLKVSQDRIGWLTNAMEYIEFSLDGRELRRYPAPTAQNHAIGLALSEQNDVCIGVVDLGRGWKVWTLNREQGTWISVAIDSTDPTRWGRLLGFDGDALVAVAGGIHRYKLSVPGSTHAVKQH